MIKITNIDLHMHTTVSDGTDTPREILYKVIEAGVDLFSVSDHDAYKAGTLIPDYLEDIEPDKRPAFIRGVEFSCEDEYGKYHILGYGYDPQTQGIRNVVEAGHELRMEKLQGRIDFLMDSFGFTFTDEEINWLMSLDNPGKPHLANLMVEHGYVENKAEAFGNYLNKKKFKRDHIRPETAIEGILKSNGIPVLAHPPYGSGDELIVGQDMDDRLHHLMNFGIQGVEGFYSGFTPKMQEDMLAFAARYDLYVTAGSDYHGRNKMISIGETNMNDMSEAPAGMIRFLKDVTII